MKLVNEFPNKCWTRISINRLLIKFTDTSAVNRLTGSTTKYPHCRQVAQLSQIDRAAGWVSFGQKWKTGTERQYFADIISLSSTTVT